MALYNLIFQGEIVADISLEEVKKNIAKLFNADAEKTAQLFSGKPIVIKKNLDEETIQKYLAVLNKAGAIIQQIPVHDQTAAIETPPDDNPSVSQAEVPTPVPQMSSGGLSSSLSALVNYNRNYSA